MKLLDQPLPSVQAYVDFFSARPLPVLRRTVRELDALRTSGESIGAKQIAAIVLADPLMTMRLLTHIERHRTQSQNHDITTIERAIMMMGVEPFFNTFSDMPTVESVLGDQPKALIGVLKVVARAHRTANYARDFAVIRHDLDVQEITVAALLHEATEMVFWVFAPELTQRVYALQAANPHLRSAQAQREVLGASTKELQLELVRAWRLPQLLVQLLDESLQENPRILTIKLAADYVRHLAHGWDDAALPDDIQALSTLLRLGPEPLLHRLGVPEAQRARFLPTAAP